MNKEVLGRRALARYLSPMVVLAACALGGPAPASEDVTSLSTFSLERAVTPDPGCRDIDPDAQVQRVVETSLYEGGQPGHFCGPGISNGEGVVALDNRFFDAGRGYAVWVMKPLGGGPTIGEILGAAQLVPALLPQDDGWVGLSDHRGQLKWLVGWSSDGTELNRTAVRRRSYQAPDFTSGALVVSEDETSDLLRVQRFDSEGAPRSAAVEVAAGARHLVAASVDEYRDTLVLFDGSTVGLPPSHMAGRWISPSGVYLTDVFDTGLAFTLFSPGVLAPLYDGSLALQVRGQWSARFTHLSTGPAEPAPEWLAARPETRLVRIRDGKGYALIPKAGEVAECRQQIFLYTKKGRSCGAATFTVDDLPCTTRELNVGPDGTVVQLSPRGECVGDPCRYRPCTYSWWPNLLGHGRGGPRCE